MRNNKFRYLQVVFLCFCVLAGFSACAKTIYGVPEDYWNKMTEEQKQTAIEGYNERERLREIERQRDVDRMARDAEMQAIELRRQEQMLEERVDAIYRGESGQYGDLIRVTIRGGEIRIAGRHRNYHPISFKIADGETKKVRVIHDEGKYGTYEDLHIFYRDGVLYLDTYESDVRGALRLVYDHTWKSGQKYIGMHSDGRLRIRNAQVLIEIIPHLRGKRF
jgi:hypothetical protein